jgi:membrane associated rhomboid family serine protease
VVEHQDIEFLQAFWTRRAVLAYSVFALNFIIFVLMAFAGGSENPQTLVNFGAKSNLHINQGEIWRFVTPIFIHIGILHLAFKSYALWVIGPQVEKLYGGPRFLLLYILTGIGGVGASYWYHPEIPGIPSAGASGAIFGMFGVLLVFSIRYRKSVPAFFSRALGKGVLLTVAINLAIGYHVEMIDNAAHLGGLITGGLLGFVVPFARPGHQERLFFKVVQAALVVLVAASFFQVAAHYSGPGLSVTNLLRGMKQPSGGSPGDFEHLFRQGQQAFEYAELMLENDDLRQLADLSRDLERAKIRIENLPPVNAEADKLSADLIEILEDEYAYLEEVGRSGERRDDFIGASPQSRRYERLKGRFEAWLEKEGASAPSK